MRVRFLLDAALLNARTQRYRKLLTGRVYDLPDENAAKFIERGAAVEAAAEEQPEAQNAGQHDDED